MNIYTNEEITKDKIAAFFKLHWGSSKMVISSGIYDCSTLDGFIILNEEDKIIGLITYIFKEKECEIISLDSIEEGKGIGTHLVQAVENLAINRKCKLVKLITTNDNLRALKFYQKRGFILSQIINDAVEKARKIKPEIPFIGNDGIPIRDEIELIKVLN
ncbi:MULTISPECIES: GNAT family N-acetyltransferase [Bacillaceae]|uniref:GNAT family N-acetyltransferase n=1 Tax=Evansella alkalicola TaxID=745819 RepID=A0ABS6JWS4_9BACI|nr:MULTISPECIES: GNAT family N-acetyltransferase [Bacillaceae]MBU9723039.1 GNAT family N-acetyltransferase [Bacillus alkalicola]